MGPSLVFLALEGVEIRGTSFYLFVLAMEVLSCLLVGAREGSYTSGFRVRGRGWRYLIFCL